jgi:hypothetical protein
MRGLCHQVVYAPCRHVDRVPLAGRMLCHHVVRTSRDVGQPDRSGAEQTGRSRALARSAIADRSVGQAYTEALPDAWSTLTMGNGRGRWRGGPDAHTPVPTTAPDAIRTPSAASLSASVMSHVP